MEDQPVSQKISHAIMATLAASFFAMIADSIRYSGLEQRGYGFLATALFLYLAYRLGHNAGKSEVNEERKNYGPAEPESKDRFNLPL